MSMFVVVHLKNSAPLNESSHCLPVVPDFLQPSSVEQFRHWSYKLDGDPSFWPRLRLIRIWTAEERKQDVLVEQEGVASTTEDEPQREGMAVDS
jgi:hypothetical protein